jgi:hypothetical protein
MTQPEIGEAPYGQFPLVVQSMVSERDGWKEKFA